MSPTKFVHSSNKYDKRLYNLETVKNQITSREKCSFMKIITVLTLYNCVYTSFRAWPWYYRLLTKWK